MSTALSLSSLYHEIRAELELVRLRVREHWTETFHLVYGPSATPPRLGGKLLRPALCLLSAGASGAVSTNSGELRRFVDMAAAMELLHLAALAHDDVVDSAELRRGERSLNARWTNHIAVLGGDYLVARALTVLTVYDRCSVLASALESIHEMAEGELINFGRGKDAMGANLGEEDSIRLAEKKTASLFAVSCATPSLLVDEGYRDALHAFGMGIGTAFQLVDDVLDLVQDEATLGKPACGDIIEGKRTLPIIYLRERMTPDEIRRLESFKGRTMSAADKEWVAESARATGAEERALVVARKYLADARTSLGSLPPSRYADAMLGIADFVLVRDS